MGALIRIFLLWLMANSCAHGDDSFPDCKDAGLMDGSLFENFCFECLLPVRIATLPNQTGPLPSDPTTQAVCSCDGESYGVTVGSWHPARLIEVVTTPGCSPLLGGIHLFPTLKHYKGTVGRGEPHGVGTSFFHVHSFPFPLATLLDPLGDTPCRSTNDAAPAYFSELDPGWNLETLSLLIQPEATFFLTPEGIESCAADAAAAALGIPIDVQFWCGGSWGVIYPMTGVMRSTLGTDPALTSLAALRHQALLHREGIGLKTSGDAALCGGVPSPFMEKSQYRLSRISPYPERSGNHAIGAATSQWAAMPTTNPMEGQSTLYILWRFEDCCIPLI